MIKPHQYIQYHNQLKRIAEAGKRAELALKGQATECMTMFSRIPNVAFNYGASNEIFTIRGFGNKIK